MYLLPRDGLDACLHEGHAAGIGNEHWVRIEGGLGRRKWLAYEPSIAYRRPAIGKMRTLMSKDRRVRGTIR